VGHTCGQQVRSYIVLPRDQATSPSNLSVVRDISHAMNRRYGARCLYLIRPDAYVGFRSQPADASALLAHLATVFK